MYVTKPAGTKQLTATATCQYCPWSAVMTGDDLVEVGSFLRQRCVEHQTTMHADQLPPVSGGRRSP